MNSACKQGRVVYIDSEVIHVEVMQHSACRSCQAKSLCHMTESESHVFIVANTTSEINMHDSVNLTITQQKGLLAVVIAYILPVLVFLGIVLVGSWVHWHELLTAGGGMLFICLYFFMLYLYRNKLNTAFQISIRKN